MALTSGASMGEVGTTGGTSSGIGNTCESCCVLVTGLRSGFCVLQSCTPSLPFVLQASTRAASLPCRGESSLGPWYAKPLYPATNRWFAAPQRQWVEGARQGRISCLCSDCGGLHGGACNSMIPSSLSTFCAQTLVEMRVLGKPMHSKGGFFNCEDYGE